jgi:hypothetical protein
LSERFPQKLRPNDKISQKAAAELYCWVGHRHETKTGFVGQSMLKGKNDRALGVT